MESNIPSSSLGSRSHTKEQSSAIPPVAVPHLSFRHRRRTKQRKTTAPMPNPSTSSHPSPTNNSTFRPWYRIRTRISNVDPLTRPNSPLSGPSPTSTAVSSLTTAVPPDDKQSRCDDEVSPTVSSATPSPTSSANHDPLVAIKASKPPLKSDVSNDSHPRRMHTNNSSQKKHPIRRLVPPTRSVFLDKKNASVTDYLRPTLIPVGYTPESVDPSFRSHRHFLRKITLDDFDLNRYLFAYKPLARVNAVLASTLLSVSAVEQKGCPMSAALRSGVMYIVGNAFRSLYVMTFAVQLKSSSRSQPAAEGILPAMVLEGKGLSDIEVAALDYVQELSSISATVSDITRRKVIDGEENVDGKLERLVTGTAAYGAFLSCLTSTIDIELTHSAIQYATLHLDGLPWKASGSPVNVDFVNDDITDFGSGNGQTGSSKYKPKRERLSLTRNYERHARTRPGSRGRPRGIRMMSHFFSSTLVGSKGSSDIGKVTETWMKAAGVPAAGNLFDMNDEIFSLYGFHPFYFSTVAMEGEMTRRALLFGVKELLFNETDIPVRLKFILCYVISSSKERRRMADAEVSTAFEKQGTKNGVSINSVYSVREYDGLSIMSAHAAFLACKYGATPAELVAASDMSRVRSASERYRVESGNPTMPTPNSTFVLSHKECAAVLIAHSLVKESVCIAEEDLRGFSESFKRKDHEVDGELTGQKALMEIFGAASMWTCLERYAIGTLGFDIDYTSNMCFGMGRAESAISEFCVSDDGRKIGLSVTSDEVEGVGRGISHSNATRTVSAQPRADKLKKSSKKRTSSALNSSTRVGRLFGNSGSAGSSALRRGAVAAG